MGLYLLRIAATCSLAGALLGQGATQPTPAPQKPRLDPAWRPVWVEVTAYCPCKVCCGPQAQGVTANGTSVQNEPYNFAGDRYWWPFGARVWVPLGHGVLDNARKSDRVFTVDDRGAALDKESRRKKIPRLDLRVREHWWAVQFGRKQFLIFVADAPRP